MWRSRGLLRIGRSADLADFRRHTASVARLRTPPPKLVAYALMAWPPHTLAYVVVPVLVARRGRRGGWRGGRPGKANVLGGVPLLVAGASFIAWAIVSHYRVSPPGVQVRVLPEYLVRGGAYRLSRNPMYAGGLTMWAGWAALFGSLPVAAVGSVFAGGLAGVGVPFEERMLLRRFGSSYDAYRVSTPRWFGWGSAGIGHLAETRMIRTN